MDAVLEKIRMRATGLRFENAKPRKELGSPEQLMIF